MASARQNNGNQWKETGMCDCTSQPSSFKVLGSVNICGDYEA